jgi:hypothetical protein
MIRRFALFTCHINKRLCFMFNQKFTSIQKFLQITLQYTYIHIYYIIYIYYSLAGTIYTSHNGPPMLVSVICQPKLKEKICFQYVTSKIVIPGPSQFLLVFHSILRHSETKQVITTGHSLHYTYVSDILKYHDNI